jgi:hypothetical protein
MDTYRVMLFLHIVSLAIGLSAATLLTLSLFRLRDAATLEDAAPWGAFAQNAEKAFPVAIIGLFATGAYMTSHIWSWSTGWILVSLIGLVFLATVGPVVGGWAVKRLEHTLQENGPGDLGDVARQMTRHPALWVTEFGNIGLVFGIIWNMTQKPGTMEAVFALLVAYVIGVALALRFSRAPAAELPAAANATR